MSRTSAAACLVLALSLAACANRSAPAPEASSPAPAANTKIVASTDGTFSGEIVGNIKPGSKFSKLKIGMTMAQVQKLIKAPDDMTRHETGKRWIPFYFGNDSQRLQTYYEGEGCLTYTGGNVFGGGENQLIRIAADSTRACFE